MEDNKQKRFFTIGSGELRAKKIDESRVEVTGIPIVFDKRSVLINDWAGTYYEQIARGATDYAFSREDNDIILTFNHNWDDLPLARYRNGDDKNTMSYTVEDDGVHMTATLNLKRTDVNNVVEAINDGIIRAHSFIFTTKSDRWERIKENEKEYDLRTVTAFDRIFEFSFVINPAYTDATIDKRSYEEYKRSLEVSNEVIEPKEEVNDIEILDVELFLMNNK